MLKSNIKKYALLTLDLIIISVLLFVPYLRIALYSKGEPTYYFESAVGSKIDYNYVYDFTNTSGIFDGYDNLINIIGLTIIILILVHGVLLFVYPKLSKWLYIAAAITAFISFPHTAFFKIQDLATGAGGGSPMPLLLNLIKFSNPAAVVIIAVALIAFSIELKQEFALSDILNTLFMSSSTFLLFVIWYMVSAVGILDEGLISPPLVVLERLYSNIFETDFITKHGAASLTRVIYSLLISSAVGLTLGTLLGTVLKSIQPVMKPLMHFLEKLNPIALFPVFMLFFGIGDVSKIAIVFCVILWAITFNTLTGFDTVDPVLVKAARASGAGKLRIFWTVRLQSALPDIFHGLKSAISTAFVFIISVEMLSSTEGIGYFVANAKKVYNLPNVYSSIIFVVIFGIILSKSLGLLEKKLFVWRQKTI